MVETPNPWAESFRGHAFHESYFRTAATIDGAAEAAREDLQALSGVHRLQAIFRWLSTVINGCDPLLVPVSSLDGMKTAIDEIETNLAGYASDRSFDRLTAANTAADRLLVGGSRLPYPRTPETVAAAGETFQKLRKSLDVHVAGLGVLANESREEVASIRAEAARVQEETRTQATASLEELRAQVAGLTTDITSQKTRLDTAISTLQTQMTTAEGERAQRFVDGELKRGETATASEDQRRTAFIAQLDEQKTTFQTLAEQMKEATSAIEETALAVDKKREELFAARVESQKSDFAALATEFGNKATSVVKKIDEEREKAVKLVSVVGDTVTVGSYQRTANQERRAAFWWRLLTVTSMVFLVGIAVWTLFGAGKDFSWPQLGARVFVASAIGALAAYAGRQAANHRDAERKSRKMELELAAIDPFIVLLPETEKIAIKRALAERIFAQPDRVLKDEVTAPNLLDMAKSTVDVAAKVLDRSKPPA